MKLIGGTASKLFVVMIVASFLVPVAVSAIQQSTVNINLDELGDIPFIYTVNSLPMPVNFVTTAKEDTILLFTVDGDMRDFTINGVPEYLKADCVNKLLFFVREGTNTFSITPSMGSTISFANLDRPEISFSNDELPVRIAGTTIALEGLRPLDKRYFANILLADSEGSAENLDVVFEFVSDSLDYVITVSNQIVDYGEIRDAGKTLNLPSGTDTAAGFVSDTPAVFDMVLDASSTVVSNAQTTARDYGDGALDIVNDTINSLGLTLKNSDAKTPAPPENGMVYPASDSSVSVMEGDRIYAYINSNSESLKTNDEVVFAITAPDGFTEIKTFKLGDVLPQGALLEGVYGVEDDVMRDVSGLIDGALQKTDETADSAIYSLNEKRHFEIGDVRYNEDMIKRSNSLRTARLSQDTKLYNTRGTMIAVDRTGQSSQLCTYAVEDSELRFYDISDAMNYNMMFAADSNNIVVHDAVTSSCYAADYSVDAENVILTDAISLSSDNLNLAVESKNILLSDSATDLSRTFAYSIDQGSLTIDDISEEGHQTAISQLLNGYIIIKKEALENMDAQAIALERSIFDDMEGTSLIVDEAAVGLLSSGPVMLEREAFESMDEGSGSVDEKLDSAQSAISVLDEAALTRLKNEKSDGDEDIYQAIRSGAIVVDGVSLEALESAYLVIDRSAASVISDRTRILDKVSFGSLSSNAFVTDSESLPDAITSAFSASTLELGSTTPRTKGIGSLSFTGAGVNAGLLEELQNMNVALASIDREAVNLGTLQKLQQLDLILDSMGRTSIDGDALGQMQKAESILGSVELSSLDAGSFRDVMEINALLATIDERSSSLSALNAFKGADSILDSLDGSGFDPGTAGRFYEIGDLLDAADRDLLNGATLDALHMMDEILGSIREEDADGETIDALQQFDTILDSQMDILSDSGEIIDVGRQLNAALLKDGIIQQVGKSQLSTLLDRYEVTVRETDITARDLLTGIANKYHYDVIDDRLVLYDAADDRFAESRLLADEGFLELGKSNDAASGQTRALVLQTCVDLIELNDEAGNLERAYIDSGTLTLLEAKDDHYEKTKYNIEYGELSCRQVNDEQTESQKLMIDGGTLVMKNAMLENAAATKYSITAGELAVVENIHYTRDCNIQFLELGDLQLYNIQKTDRDVTLSSRVLGDSIDADIIYEADLAGSDLLNLLREYNIDALQAESSIQGTRNELYETIAEEEIWTLQLDLTHLEGHPCDGTWQISVIPNEHRDLQLNIANTVVTGDVSPDASTPLVIEGLEMRVGGKDLVFDKTTASPVFVNWHTDELVEDQQDIDEMKFFAPDEDDIIDIAVDTDSDGLSNVDEVRMGTNPFDIDSDDDLVADADEVYHYGTDPLDADTDDDRLIDGYEIYTYFTDPLDPDTDDDEFMDGAEVSYWLANGIDPNSDSDGNGLPNILDPDSDKDTFIEGETFIDMRDGLEVQYGMTLPWLADTDGDGLEDGKEIAFWLGYLSSRKLDPMGDIDGDGIPNIQDWDSDSDKLSDGEEFDTFEWDVERHSDPVLTDTDFDGLGDFDELKIYGTHCNNIDTDRDALYDYEEVKIHGTDPHKWDTDDDEMPDRWEVDMLTNPTNPDAYDDPDGDNLVNIEEYRNYCDPRDADSDNDLLDDGAEIKIHYTDPLRPDSDDDKILDGEEVETGTDGYITNPLSPDSDGDGFGDFEEVNSGLDGYITKPNDPDYATLIMKFPEKPECGMRQAGPHIFGKAVLPAAF